ncbi:unnamed protein product, partial [Iphiclides podalirius]
MKDAAAMGDTPVQKFYEGSVVFVTGGTGFLGKLLIEKLLRTCAPSKIYVLIREKKEKGSKERLSQALKDPLFDELRKLRVNWEENIYAVQGDISEIKLGIDDYDWETLRKEVNVIFHMAANVRFDVELKAALLSNTRGTREALRLAADCTQLRAFVYVSTAYSHATRDRINGTVWESFYDAPAPPDAIITLAETLSVEKLNAMTPTLINGWPNTYTFSKAIAEEVVRTKHRDLPICVVRPAIVTCTYRDPIPGWLDMSCAYGPSGFVLGLGLGLTHVAFFDGGLRIDIVPADIVNSTIMAAAWETNCKGISKNRHQPPMIYTVSSSRNGLLFKTMEQSLHSITKTIASSKAIWYCFGFQTKYKVCYNLLTIFLHFIPAYIVDGVCLLLGKPRMLVKIYKKVDKLSNALSYFSTNQWTFEDQNAQNLFKNLSPVDKQIFDMDITAVDWEKKIRIWCLGIRKYLLKDSEKSFDYALKRQKLLRIVHYIISVVYIYLMWKFINLCFDLFCTIVKIFE